MFRGSERFLPLYLFARFVLWGAPGVFCFLNAGSVFGLYQQFRAVPRKPVFRAPHASGRGAFCLYTFVNEIVQGMPTPML